MSLRTDMLSMALAGVCVVAITVLAALGQPVPEVLPTVALVAIGAGGGAAIPQLRVPRALTADPAAQVLATSAPPPASAQPGVTQPAQGVTSVHGRAGL